MKVKLLVNLSCGREIGIVSAGTVFEDTESEMPDYIQYEIDNRPHNIEVLDSTPKAPAMVEEEAPKAADAAEKETPKPVRPARAARA